MTLSREKLSRRQIFLGDAIRALREALTLSQEEMAHQIGCTYAAYRQWEAGRRVPSGDWLIQILAMCPDRESMEAFGLHFPQTERSSTRPKSTAESQGSKFQEAEGRTMTTDSKTRDLRARLAVIVEELESRIQNGDRTALEYRRDLAERLSRASGLATQPGLSKSRRKKMLEEEIVKLQNPES